VSEFNIIIAGFGGQGVLFAGRILTLAGMIEGKEVSWLPSYGPEMRGGTANCCVCISERPIGSPLVTAPDILVALNRPSFDKFIGKVVPGGLVFTDSSFVDPSLNVRDDIKTFFTPAAQIVSSEGLAGLSNLFMLGKMMCETAISTTRAVKRAIEEATPQRNRHLIEPNIRAFEMGVNL